METPLLVASVGVVGALVGSTVGGLISFLSTKAVRKMEWEQGLVEKDLRNREDLYAEFLSEASRLVLLSLGGEKKFLESIEFSRLVTLEAKVWFHSEPLGRQAREIARIVLREFKDRDEVESTDKSKKDEDLTGFASLRDKFIVDCKNDLQEVRKNIN